MASFLFDARKMNKFLIKTLLASYIIDKIKSYIDLEETLLFLVTVQFNILNIVY